MIEQNPKLGEYITAQDQYHIIRSNIELFIAVENNKVSIIRN